MKSPERHLLVFCLVAVLSTGAFILFDTVHEFQRNQNMMTAELDGHVNLLAEHAKLSFRGVDILMSGVAMAFRRNSPQSLLPDRAMNENLRQILNYVPQLAAVAILDAAGNGLVWMGASSLEALDLDGADLVAIFESSDEARHMGGLLKDQASGRSFIPMSARITSAGGQFYGIVLALVDIDYFRYFHKQLDPEGSRRVGMYRKGGLTLTLSNEPTGAKAGMLSEEFVALLPLKNFVGVSPLDGSKRITAYQRLNEYPISMTVSEDYSSFIRGHYDWWARRTLLFLLVVVATWICYKATSRSIASGEKLREQRVQMLQQQRDFERISREIIHHNPNGRAAVLDMDLRYLFADGGAFSRHKRLAPHRVIGKRIRDVHGPGVADTLEQLIEKAFETGEAAADVISGGGRVYEVTAVPLRDDADCIDRLLVLSQDITNFHRTRQSLEARNQELQEISVTDALLGISNRRGLDNQLDLEWSRSQRGSQPLSVLMIDVDHFKVFNDTYGHAAGDECLRQVAAAIGEAVYRPGDLVARYGGEEFAVLLPATDLNGALGVADRIHLALESRAISFPESPITPHLTLSIGIASMVPGADDQPDSILRRADSALYRAKTGGRNRTFVYGAKAEVVTEG